MVDEPPQKANFWTTLQGILTGLAAVLTATGGIIVGIHKLRGRSEDPAPQAPSAPVLTQPQPSTSVCADARDSNCIGTVNGPVTINPKSQPESHVGTLGSSDKVLLSPGGVIAPLLQIGDSSIFIRVWDGTSGDFFFGYSRRYHLVVESINGKLAVSTKVADRTGALIAEIIRNEWQVAQPPKTWDLNYNDNALEVKNDQGDIVLQVVAFPGLIRLQGEWWDNDYGIRLVSDGPGLGAVIAALGPGKTVPEKQIKPMFVYPSQTHFGKLTAFGQSLSKGTR